MSTFSNMDISIKLIHQNAKMPVIANSGDAAMDLFVSETTIIPAKCQDRVIIGGLIPDDSINLVVADEAIPAVLNRGLVPSGISIAIPPGYYARVAPRSGLSCKGFDVGAGVIDSGYRGEIKVLMINNSTESRTFEVGEKFAQLILTKIMDAPILVEVSDLPPSDRGNSGFGSSGSK
jgi:dUTP pyrophosphatase